MVARNSVFLITLEGEKDRPANFASQKFKKLTKKSHDKEPLNNLK